MKLSSKALVPVLVIAMMIGCSDDPSSSTEGDTNATASSTGGDLRFAIATDAVILDPHRFNDVATSLVLSNTYESLVMHDDDMEIVPRLAESFEQIDELTLEMVLRNDVTFHDGSSFDAYTVEANIERIQDPDIASPRAFMYDAISEVNVIEDDTIHIKTNEPYAPLLANLTSLSMISSDAIEKHENGELDLSVEIAGTGPFSLLNWEQGNEVRYEAYEEYWGSVANIDTLTFQVVPEEGTRLAMLENEEAHVVDNIEPTNMSRVEAMPNAEVSVSNGLRTEYIGFNVQKEPFNDPLVRKALAHAIDANTITEGIYEGYGVRATAPISEHVFGYSNQLTNYPYDVDLAKQLLEEAGFPDGFETTILTNDAHPMRIQIAEVIQSQLEDVGVRAQIHSMEWGAYLDATANGEQEIYMLGWTTSNADADFGLFPMYHSDSFGYTGNRSFYSNDEVDALLEEAKVEMDEEKRLELYEEAMEIIMIEAPKVFTVQEQLRIGVSDKVNHFSLQHPSGRLLFNEVTISSEATY
ncbi:glutathione ABC transporter substrate-binding protein [Geomicrobium sp. JCM 19055]|uniref:glutathione ABC transporter substrate-binding protein n=1 Tax=Geomicrobium sp. JCM 19055 TaxID=1460649 RepID=UPI00045ED840|nr:glutathione ABC transporter substrate-binding protein [Geomicrobium sp. JCM 19055]GAJ98088.1 oligopeptide ABC transporter, periplasmic oligopeptide-binding protein OppA [Geomicrobium sp. JCM 19055]